MSQKLKTSSKAKKAKALRLRDVGKMGNEIYTDVVKGLKDTELKPVGGSIKIGVYLEVIDTHLFGDDELHNADLVINVDLGEN